MTVPVTPDEPAAAPAVVEEMPGVRAGSIVFLGIAAGNVGNYVFHFISARLLGPASYGDVASLVAVIGLLSLPLVGVQVAVTRYVAGFAAKGEADSIRLLFIKSLRLALAVGVVATAALGILAVPLREFLGIGSTSAVIFTALVTLPAVASPVVWGLTQGLHRFVLFSTAIALGPALRAVLAGILLGAGLGVAGAMGATFVATAVAVVVPLIVVRQWLAADRKRPTPIPGPEVVRYLVPVMVGVLSITSLTTIDVIVAKAALSDHDAGLYGSASLIGRVILYLPAAIVLVLLPKVSAREAAGRDSRDVLTKSVLVTAAFCTLGTAVYAIAPKLVILAAFGSDFEEAGALLWMFGLAMSGYALLNVLLAYHLARAEYRLSMLLAAGAVVQIALFGAFHGSPEELLTIDIAIAFGLLFAHELLVERSARLVLR